MNLNRFVALTVLISALATITVAADQPGIRAVLVAAKERKPAPDFALTDAFGKTVKLSDSRGKVVLLDFWATWCTGCKKEIPWFSEFHKTYEREGFAAIGVSLDDGGWSILKPFLAGTQIPYQILLGDESIAKRYGIKNMPDTFLIDRGGRIAAAYTAGLVDKDDAESHIRVLLSEHR